jgi:hypothetical protein
MTVMTTITKEVTMMDLYEHSTDVSGAKIVSMAFITPGQDKVVYDSVSFKSDVDAKRYVVSSVMHHILQCMDFLANEMNTPDSADKQTIIRGKRYLAEHMKDVQEFLSVTFRMRHILKAYAYTFDPDNKDQFNRGMYAIQTIIRNSYDYLERLRSDNFFQDRKVLIPD